MQKENSYKSQANTTSSNETNSIQLCLNIKSNLIETWYLDSRATQHTTLHGEWFYDNRNLIFPYLYTWELLVPNKP
jgi:hypothetical protein